MPTYRVEVETNDPIPAQSALQFLTESVANALETLGLEEDGDYRVETYGPAELRIGVRFR